MSNHHNRPKYSHDIVTIIWAGCGDLTLCVFWKVICQHEKPEIFRLPDSSNKRPNGRINITNCRLFDESGDGIFMTFHVDK